MDWSKTVSLFQKLVAMAAVAAIAYVGENGQDGGFIKDVWAQAKVASTFGAMLALLLLADERRERRHAQKELNERTIDFIKSTNLQTSAAEKVGSAVSQMAVATAEVGAYFKFSTPVKKKGRQR